MIKKNYMCNHCGILFQSNEKYPICSMCKTKAYGLKHRFRCIVNLDNIKTLGVIMLIGLTITIWFVGLMTVIEYIMGWY